MLDGNFRIVRRCMDMFEEGVWVDGKMVRPHLSRVCEKCEFFRGKCRYPVLRGLLENLVELVKVRLRVLTRRLK